MSVIIKSMKMPPSCYFCGLTDTSFIHCEAFSPTKLLEDDCEERRPKWCPLIELPPHGRLIDADRLVPILKCVSEAEGQIYGHCNWNFAGKCINEIDNAPTVLEAELEE